jgi:hypothetical protein
MNAQTNEKREEIKEEFYNFSEQNINQIANSDMKILLGDSNAKVGKEDIYIDIYKNDAFRNIQNFKCKKCNIST